MSNLSKGDAMKATEGQEPTLHRSRRKGKGEPARRVRLRLISEYDVDTPAGANHDEQVKAAIALATKHAQGGAQPGVTIVDEKITASLKAANGDDQRYEVQGGVIRQDQKPMPAVYVHVGADRSTSILTDHPVRLMINIVDPEDVADSALIVGEMPANVFSSQLNQAIDLAEDAVKNGAKDGQLTATVISEIDRLLRTRSH